MVNKQQICLNVVNTALQKLTKINPFYSNITVDNEWEHLSEQSDLVLWKLLTDKNARQSDSSDQTDSDDGMEGLDKVKERELKESSLPFLNVMYNEDGPNISPSEIVNLTLGEGKIPVSFTSEPNWEALPFCKDYSSGRNHFNEEREISITTSKYLDVGLKCCEDRFPANPQYTFHALDWIKGNSVVSSVHFVERKQFQIKIKVG